MMDIIVSENKNDIQEITNDWIYQLPERQYYILEVDNVKVGFISRNKYGYCRIHVKESERHKGYATYLLENCKVGQFPVYITSDVNTLFLKVFGKAERTEENKNYYGVL